MTKIDVDTLKLKEETQKFISSSNDYEKIINDVFDMIIEIPDKKIWTGTAGKEYAKKIKSEKDKYVSHTKNMKDIGDILLEYINSLENGIK